jgi:putative ABC transport system permease protein
MLLGIALGVALSTAISLINRSTIASFRQSVDAVTGSAALTLSAGESGLLESTVEQLGQYREIRAAVPMTENATYYKTRAGAFEPLQILGIDLLKDTSVRTYRTDDDQIIEDPLVFLNRPDSVILTREFADRHGIALDDRVELTTALGLRTLTVRGLLSPSGPARAYGGSIGIMDIDGARLTFGKEGRVDRVDLVLRRGRVAGPSDPEEADAALQRLASRIEADLRREVGANISVEHPETQSRNFENLVASFQGMLTFLSLLALLVGVFLVFNSVSVAVAERRRELGTLRALGGKRGLILSLILLESLLLGLASSLLGYALGEVLASQLLEKAVRGLSNQVGTLVRVSRITSDGWDLLRALLTGTCATTLAAWLPAWRATRIPPVEALRPKGIGEPGETTQLASLSGQDTRTGVFTRLFFRLLFFFRSEPGRVTLGLGLFAYLFVASLLDPRGPLGAIEPLHPPLGVLGAVLLAPPAALALIRKLASRLPSRSLLLRLATENLLRSSRRTSANVLSLIVGLMLVVTISALHVSFQRTLMDWTRKLSEAGDLMVSQNGRIAQLQVQPIHQDLLIDLEALPGVADSADRHVRGIRFLKLRYPGPERVLQLAIKAFDPPPRLDREGREPRFPALDAIDPPAAVQGGALFFSEEPRTLVSESFVRKTGLGLGGTLRLETPSGPVDFAIVGVVRDFASPDGVLYFNREVYRRLWRDPLITAAMLSAADGVTPTALKERVDASVGKKYGVISVLNSELSQQVVRLVDESFAFDRAIQLASLLVGLLGLMNTLLIGLLERTREIGLFRAVGMTRGQLSRLLLLECLIQGALGAAVAVVLGTGLSFFFIRSTLSRLLGWVIDFHFPLGASLEVLLTGIAVAALAGTLPAYRASRLQIRDALEYE